MPPEMIATEKYKKLPAGRTFTCSSSSAKALSALGMANYHNAASVTGLTREMSAGPEFTSQAGSQIASALSLPENPVIADVKAALGALGVLSNSSESSEPDAAIAPADVPRETDGQSTTETVTPVEPVVPVVLEPTLAPVTGSVNASTEDATIVANKQKDSQKSAGNQYGNKKSDSGNQKSSVTAKNSPYKK